MKKRDSNIVATVKREISLNTRIVKSKKLYNRKREKLNLKGGCYE